MVEGEGSGVWVGGGPGVRLVRPPERPTEEA